MPLSQLLAPILGGLLGDTYPQQNPGYQGIDENGNFIGGQAPYKKSGFFTRALHPDVAQTTGALNDRAHNEWLQNQIANQIAAKNIKDAGDYTSPVVTATPMQAAIRTGRNPSQAGMYGAESQASNLAAGIPQLSARDLAASLTKSTRGTMANLALNNPENEAATESSRLGYLKPLFESETTLTPARASTEAQELQTRGLMANVGANQASRELGADSPLSETYRNRVGTNLAESNTELGLAKTRASMSPEIQNTLRNNLIAQSFGSSMIPPEGNPFGAKIEGNTITPGQPNPLFMSPLAKISAMTQGVPQIPTTSGGKVLGVSGGGALPMLTRKFDSMGQPIANAITRQTIGKVNPTATTPQVPINPNAQAVLSKWQDESKNAQTEDLKRIQELSNKETTYTLTNSEREELNTLRTRYANK